MAAVMKMSTACQTTIDSIFQSLKNFKSFETQNKESLKIKMEKDKRKFGFFSAEAYPSSKSSAAVQSSELLSPVCGLVQPNA